MKPVSRVIMLFVAVFSECVLAVDSLNAEDKAKLTLLERKVLRAIAERDFLQLEPKQVTPKVWWAECRKSEHKELSLTEVLKRLEDRSRNQTIKATTVIDDGINDIGVETKGWAPLGAWMYFYFEGGGKYMTWTGVQECNERSWHPDVTPPEGEQETFSPRVLRHTFIQSVIQAAKAGRFDGLRAYVPTGPALVLGSCSSHDHRIHGIGHDAGEDPTLSADALIAQLIRDMGAKSKIRVTPYPESYVGQNGTHVYMETTGWANNSTGWGGNEFIRGFDFVYQSDTQKWLWVRLCTR